MMIEDLVVKTQRTEELVDLTDRLQQVVRQSGVQQGVCCVFVPHTTAGVTINEHADPDVVIDLLSALREMVPADRPWRHGEGNSPAHVKASLMGADQRVWIQDGTLDLGTWQGVFFCEFDGPRTRRVRVRISS